MKTTIKFSIFAMAMMAMCFTFTACGDDDDDNGGGNNNGGGNSSKLAGKAVDLGLSVKWADCNVGATCPEEPGTYFYGGTVSQMSAAAEDMITEEFANWYISIYNRVQQGLTIPLSGDAAHAQWGGTWRLPTRAEYQELISKCVWTWTTQEGMKGYKVVGPNGNSIFLPAAGWWRSFYNSKEAFNKYGYYWSSTVDVKYRGYDEYYVEAYYLYFYDTKYNADNNEDIIDGFYYDEKTDTWNVNSSLRAYSVRPVCAK